MKKIEAIIQPYKLEEVKEALKGAGVDGITISEVRGHGRQKGHTEIYRGPGVQALIFFPKVKVEMVVPDGHLDRVVGALSAAARSGKIGDGKIFVSTMEEAFADPQWRPRRERAVRSARVEPPRDGSCRKHQAVMATAKVVVATAVALSFISFWRGAAIVLSDLASSAFYAGGIAEQAIGKSAPWFILGVMLFSFAVRSVYMEGCSMFVRGGVYVVVRDAMGPFMARLSVSALIFDYILTGPISSVSAGQYLGRLLNEVARNDALCFARSAQSVRRWIWDHRDRSISGGTTSRAFTNPAARRCASCKSPP